MISFPARPPIAALLVAHGTTDDAVAGLVACDRTLDVRPMTAAQCRRELERLKTDVIIVDGRIPSAVELIHAIRTTRPTLPTLFLASKPDDVLPAMCAGAHDFVLATTSPAEFALRLRLLSSAMVRPVRKERRIGPLQVDRELRRLSVGVHSVSLSPIEFRMFEHLLLHPGRPASRSELQQAIWGQDELAEHPTNIAVVYVSYLRRKLARLGGVCSITTITNVGYALDLDVRPEDARHPANGRKTH